MPSQVSKYYSVVRRLHQAPDTRISFPSQVAFPPCSCFNVRNNTGCQEPFCGSKLGCMCDARFIVRNVRQQQQGSGDEEEEASRSYSRIFAKMTFSTSLLALAATMSSGSAEAALRTTNNGALETLIFRSEFRSEIRPEARVAIRRACGASTRMLNQRRRTSR